jgi:periplasmic mercuric ion binding protein
MKQIASLLALPVLLLVFGFSKPKTEQVVIKTTFYCDHYATCESKDALEKELMLTTGVKSVVIDAAAMTITVNYKAKQTNPDKIRNVISKAGYDADDVKADPKAVEKLDGCCKKKE